MELEDRRNGVRRQVEATAVLKEFASNEGELW
jgi:hypothetical protein